ncbi:MAG TPA: serine/threonine-protein kinase, partial [Gemmatimonadales bacterium]|nr:serine/threonine-protein kinase [Gemmatimonadales bacterium]
MTDEVLDRLAAALADRYLLEEALGRGASATVYLAQDVRHGRRVALKVLHAALGAALGAERFQREIRTQARLHHPHILPVFDSGEAAGHLYYVMPHVETGSLRDRLGRGPLGVAAAVQLSREVASALTYAHALGVIHRDIKPENILLSVTGHALLTDFGIAYAVDDHGEVARRLTETGVTLGTPAYMSPEQSAGDEIVEARSDVYALAVVIYEALAGRPPFEGPNARAIMARRLTEAASPIRLLREDVPAAVERSLSRALARRPEDRFESAEEFAAALQDAGQREPQTPPPATSPIPAASRRQRSLIPGGRLGRVAAIVALIAVVTLGIVGGRAVKRRTAATGPRVVAVLPFKNLGAPADQYFADGLTEEITSRLAGLSGLRVISRTSADQYRTSTQSVREIGAALGADYVLEGSVRWARAAGRGAGDNTAGDTTTEHRAAGDSSTGDRSTGDGSTGDRATGEDGATGARATGERAPPGGGRGRLRVTPQLIAVRDDSHLWADTYEAELGEVFRLQSEIAERVTTALDVALRAPERAALAAGGTRNPDAYDF